MLISGKRCVCFGLLVAACLLVTAQPDDPRQKHYTRQVRPIFMQHCFPCHNGEDNKAGINFDDFYFISSLVRRGELFQKIVQVVQEGSMPPDTRPPLSQQQVDTVAFYVTSYLQAALNEKDPGIIPPRRLNRQEYKYVIQDLFEVDIRVDSLFPGDPSGGEGFDNQAATLYISPLLLERYFEAAELVLEKLYADEAAWRRLVPAYRESLGNRLRTFWYRRVYGQDVSLQRPSQKASAVLFPIATLAYRRFLLPEEKERLLDFFRQAYTLFEGQDDRFDASIRETLRLILVSHHFLYRIEADPAREGPYPVSNFELASRLSFFLWSSIPDQQLLKAAYREDLHHPAVLQREVLRMLRHPRARRMGGQFALQWLELKKLQDPAFEMDEELYPHFSPALRQLMLKEVELMFNHVMLESQNLLELIDSDYSFMNEELAAHYGMPAIRGPEMRKVCFPSAERGGVLGTAAVLTATSLPTRTSPVLRGKWVLEQLLGTPPPPPPPNVPELETNQHDRQASVSLRSLLERHRADPACHSCHQAMDPIGLGLENFDATGKWRVTYGKQPIDPSGVMKSGEVFAGPAELRRILLNKRELFAKNFSRKMLSYALGRSIRFKDSPTIAHLQQTLLETDFNSTRFILELVSSYPFRYKKSDTQDVPRKPKKS